jgi:membrane-associated protein
VDITASFLDRLTGLPPVWLYLTAAAVLAAEVGLLAGAVVPAASTMLTVGFLAHSGRLDLTTALAVTTAAALLGDHLGYLEGRLLGPRIRRGWFGRRVGDHRWDRAERLIARRGGTAVVLGRWTAFVRTLMPRAAAAAGLPYRRFALFDAAAVLVWVPGTVLVGYLAGASYTRFTGLAGAAGTAVAAAAGHPQSGTAGGRTPPVSGRPGEPSAVDRGRRARGRRLSAGGMDLRGGRRATGPTIDALNRRLVVRAFGGAGIGHSGLHVVQPPALGCPSGLSAARPAPIARRRRDWPFLPG